MKLRSRETYWLLKNGLINTYPSLNHNLDCEILIVGAGITGALLGYQLSSEGYNVVIIDERDVAMGSTAATTAMLQYEIDEPLYSLVEKIDIQTATDCYLEGIQAIHKLEEVIQHMGIDCGFRRKQSLYFAASRSHVSWLKKEYLARDASGIQVKWKSADDLSNEFKIKAYGGILSNEGANVDAYQLTHALLEYAVTRFGLKVFDHTSFEKVRHGKNSKTVVTDDGFKINCKSIVFATGYETSQILNGKYVNLNSTYALVSEPISDLPDEIGNNIFWNTNEPYLYLRTTPDNRIILGGGDEEFKNAERRDHLIGKKEHYLLKEAKKYFPSLKIVPDFVWAGTFGVTKDSLPYIGCHKEFEGCYFVLGYGGNGITFSVMGMKIISDALSSTPNKYLDYFRFNR